MNTREIVLKILKENEEARNDDIELTIKYLERFCSNFLEKALMKRVLRKSNIPLSTIIRYRAYYQNKKKTCEAKDYIKQQRIKHRRRKQEEFWITYK